MTKAFLSTSNLFEPDKSSVIEHIGRVISENGDVDATNELERALTKYHQSRYCVTFSTGFWALVAMIMIKSKKSCDEVLMPSLTYRRLADVVYWAGKKPVFVDVDAESLAISPQSIRNNISSNTALILAVHPIVNCCDVDETIKISSEYDIPVLFDAVESVHETCNGKKIGSFSVGEVFSLHASKLLNGIEGGYVCTDDEDLNTRLINFRDRSNTVAKGIGLNSPINGIHSIFALESLNEVDTNVRHNKEVYFRYKNILSNTDGIRLLYFDETEVTSYKNIVVEVLDDFPLTRNELLEFMNKNNVLARSYYYPPLHINKYDYDVRVTDMTNTMRAAERYLNLPCGYRVGIDDVDYVCELIRAVHNE